MGENVTLSNQEGLFENLEVGKYLLLLLLFFYLLFIVILLFITFIVIINSLMKK